MIRAIFFLAILFPPVQATTQNSGSDRNVSLAAVRLLAQEQPVIVTVRATLTLNGNRVYVEDSTEGAALEDIAPQNLTIGDQLLVSGWAEDTDSGLVFRRAQVQVLWAGVPRPPLAVTADQAALGKFANLLVEVQGRLVGEEKSDRDSWLTIESGNQVFLAHFDSEKGGLPLPRPQHGSVLRLRGICSTQPQDTHYLGGFALLLRSAEDIDTISGAPWWSPSHLFLMGTVLLGLIAATHVALVRMMKARFQAIAADRARVGHEMHDTLAQSFAGVAFQIQAAKNKAPKDNPILNHHLDLALDMVRHSHSEAHRSIMMLRPQPLAETTSLQAALKQTIEQMTEGCQIQIDFAVRGTVIVLPLFVEDALYRVAQEAIANALRHGHPNNLYITLEYSARAVTLTVSDDGIGFDPASLSNNGFGLSGMKQRIRALHGTLTVVSRPGEGTQVSATIPRRGVSIAKVKSIIDSYRKVFSRTWEGRWTDQTR